MALDPQHAENLKLLAWIAGAVGGFFLALYRFFVPRGELKSYLTKVAADDPETGYQTKADALKCQEGSCKQFRQELSTQACLWADERRAAEKDRHEEIVRHNGEMKRLEEDRLREIREIKAGQSETQRRIDDIYKKGNP